MPVKIAMLGPSSVGKTSLLTAMYGARDTIRNLISLELRPDSETENTLNNQLELLKNLGREFTVQPGAGIQGTEAIAGPQSLQAFKFTLSKPGEGAPQQQLIFQDYPGGYIADNATLEEQLFVEKLLNQCDAVVIAIDAVALRYAKGRSNEIINKPTQITKMFRQAYRNLNEPRLVILAPVKCEIYMMDNNKPDQLLTSVEDSYRLLLDFFNSSEELRANVTVVVTPVQTVGCVIFGGRVDNHDRGPIFHFRKIREDSRYSPSHCEQPLLYLLVFSMMLSLRAQEQNNWNIINWIRGLYRNPREIDLAMNNLARMCRNRNGFQIVQHGHLHQNIFG